MTCFFYLLGDSDEQILSKEGDVVIAIVDGWVAREKDWWTNASKATPGGHRTPDQSIGLAERYTTSMYYVLNAFHDIYGLPNSSGHLVWSNSF